MLDDNDDFFLVLPSNVPAIQGVEQENKTSRYKTLLPRALQLDDRRSCEVGLVEICYPQSWKGGLVLDKCSYVYRRNRYNRTIHDLWLKVINDLNQSGNERAKKLADQYEVGLQAYLRDGRKMYACTSKQPVNVNDLDSLLRHLNAVRPVGMRGKFYKTGDNHLGVELQRFESIQINDKQLSDIIIFQGGIAKFRKDLVKVSRKIVKRHAPIPSTSTTAVTNSNHDKRIESLFHKNAAHYGATPNKNYYKIVTAKPVTLPPMASNIYVYSDIVAETYVGNQFVPLLRTVPIRIENRGKYVTEFFDKPRYLPLARSYIEQIEMRLCDEYGENVRFEWGHVVITLHFRRNKASPSSLG